MTRPRQTPTSVSSERALTGNTGMPDVPDGDMLPIGTSDAPLSEPTASYSQSFPELIDKSLHTKKFFRPKFLHRLITIVWFSVACFIIISDQNNDRLASVEGLKLFGIKIGILTVISLVAGLFTWIFSDKESAG